MTSRPMLTYCNVKLLPSATLLVSLSSLPPAKMLHLNSRLPRPMLSLPIKTRRLRLTISLRISLPINPPNLRWIRVPRPRTKEPIKLQ